MVQCCFMSTETRRLIRTDSPGRPPQPSHSSCDWGVGIYIQDPNFLAQTEALTTLNSKQPCTCNRFWCSFLPPHLHPAMQLRGQRMSCDLALSWPIPWPRTQTWHATYPWPRYLYHPHPGNSSWETLLCTWSASPSVPSLLALVFMQEQILFINLKGI